MQNNKISRHHFVIRLLHWSMAFLLIILVSLGWYMMAVENQAGSERYFDLHKSLGLIAAALILLRVIWRLTHKTSPLPYSIPRWQAFLSQAIHRLLYLCMIIMPITGFIAASLDKYGVAFFGLPLPMWIKQNDALSAQLFKVHGIVAWILVALVMLHILAALKHLFINKDGVFQRIWFGSVVKNINRL